MFLIHPMDILSHPGDLFFDALLSNEVTNNTLDTLIDHLNKNSPFESNEMEEQVYSVAELAIKNFQNSTKTIQQKILQAKKIFDKPKENYSHNSFTKLKDIFSNFQNVNISLLDAPLDSVIIEDYTNPQNAVKAETKLSQNPPLSETEKAIQNLFKELVIGEPTPTNQNPSDSIKKLFLEIFEYCLPTILEKNFQAFSKFQEQFFPVSSVIKRISPEKKKLFEEEILDFSLLFLKDYVIGQFPFRNNILTFLKPFLSILVGNIFFRTARNINELEKKYAQIFLKQTTLFFNDLVTAFQSLKNSKVDFKNIPIAAEELLLITLLNKQRMTCNPTWISLEPELNSCSFELHIVKRFIKSLGMNHEEEITDRFAPNFIELLNYFISPYMVSLLVNRFLVDNIAIDIKETSLPLEKIEANDLALNTNLGQQLSQLTFNILSLGDLSLLNQKNVFRKLLRKVLKNKQNKMGIYFQKSLNQITQSECLITPIRLSKQIFWTKQSENLVPSLVGCFNRTLNEKDQFQKEIEQAIKNRLYESIRKILSPHIPSPVIWLADNASSIQALCNNLSHRLYRISQQPLLLKMFLYGYILEGLIEYEKK